MQTINKQYTLSELTNGLNVSIKGDPNCLIKGISSLSNSKSGMITFLSHAQYRKHLNETQASAVILSQADAEFCPVTAVITSNPYYIYAKIAEFFAERPSAIVGIHSSVVIGERTKIHPSAQIGPHCVIGDDVTIGARVMIGSGSVIGDGVVIDEDVRLDARVTIYRRVKIGKRTCISSGVVVGSDGFGFANDKNIWHRVPQLGSVTVGNDVDIGANTTIDCGTVEDTVIEDGVKLDNLIQIAHNVKIGAHTIIAGCVGVAGSAVIGKYCMIGGASMILGHITIADHVIITGGTGVSKSIRESGMYSSGIVGVVTNQEFRKNNARFHRLENLMKRVKKLELALKEYHKEDDS